MPDINKVPSPSPLKDFSLERPARTLFRLFILGSEERTDLLKEGAVFAGIATDFLLEGKGDGGSSEESAFEFRKPSLEGASIFVLPLVTLSVSLEDELDNFLFIRGGFVILFTTIGGFVLPVFKDTTGGLDPLFLTETDGAETDNFLAGEGSIKYKN